MAGSDKQMFTERANDNLSQSDNLSETGYVDNWEATLSRTINEDLFISQYIMESPIRDRNSKLRDWIADGTISNSDAESVSVRNPRLEESHVWDYDTLAEIANKKYGLGVKTTKELDEEIKADVKLVHDMSTDVNSRATAMGSVGNFVGAFHAGALDPVNVASMAIPGVGAGATLLQKIASGAVASMAAEMIIQPKVMQWKNKVGIEYTFGDAMTNMAFAGLLGGSIPAGVAGLKSMVNKAKTKKLPVVTKDEHVEDFSSEPSPVVKDEPEISPVVKDEPEISPVVKDEIEAIEAAIEPIEQLQKELEFAPTKDTLAPVAEDIKTDTNAVDIPMEHVDIKPTRVDKGYYTLDVNDDNWTILKDEGLGEWEVRLNDELHDYYSSYKEAKNALNEVYNHAARKEPTVEDVIRKVDEASDRIQKQELRDVIEKPTELDIAARKGEIDDLTLWNSEMDDALLDFDDSMLVGALDNDGNAVSLKSILDEYAEFDAKLDNAIKCMGGTI